MIWSRQSGEWDSLTVRKTETANDPTLWHRSQEPRGGGGGHTWRQLERALNRCPRITHSFIIIHLQCIQCGFDCPPPCRGWLPWPFPQGPYRAKISPSPSVQSPLDDWRQPQSQTALAWTPNPCPAATSGSAGSPTLRVYFGSEDY